MVLYCHPLVSAIQVGSRGALYHIFDAGICWAEDLGRKCGSAYKLLSCLLVHAGTLALVDLVAGDGLHNSALIIRRPSLLLVFAHSPAYR